MHPQHDAGGYHYFGYHQGTGTGTASIKDFFALNTTTFQVLYFSAAGAGAVRSGPVFFAGARTSSGSVPLSLAVPFLFSLKHLGFVLRKRRLLHYFVLNTIECEATYHCFKSVLISGWTVM